MTTVVAASLGEGVEVLHRAKPTDPTLVYVGSTRRYVSLDREAALAVEQLTATVDGTIPIGPTAIALARSGVIEVAGLSPKPISRWRRYRLGGYTWRLPLFKKLEFLRPLGRRLVIPVAQITSMRTAVLWMIALSVAIFAMDPAAPTTVATLGVLVAVLAFHEFLHTVTAVSLGVIPRSVGVGLYLCLPMAYVDYTDIYRLQKVDSQRVALAGPIADAISLLVLSIVAFVAGTEELLRAPILLAVLNANPLMGSDIKRAASKTTQPKVDRLRWLVIWMVVVVPLLWRLL